MPRSRAALPADALAGLRAEIAAQLRNARGAPSASDALRMLLAIRAVGSLGLPGLIPNLLALPERVDRPRWAGAVIELGRRMGEASEAEDPRLEILPAWAREPTALLTVRAQDALDDAVRDSILSMGDLAVPALILESHRRERPAARRRRGVCWWASVASPSGPNFKYGTPASRRRSFAPSGPSADRAR